MSLHPTLAAAAAGRMPDWSRMGSERREHVRRVADLMGSWAEQMGREPEEVARWRAAGFLHDSVRDAPPSELAEELGEDFADLPGKMLHGPAAAKRLREEGVRDEDFLRAVAYHTIGHPRLDELGRFLYAADFLEPGRPYLSEWRAELRARVTEEPSEILREVARARIRNLLEGFRTIRPETHEFWNVLMGEKEDERA